MVNLKIHRSTILFSLTVFVILISIVAAMRLFGVDKDYFEYLYFFQEVDFGYSGRFEPGFVLFAIFLKEIFGDFGIFLFFVAIVSLSIKFYLLSRLPYFFYWVILYFAMFLFIHEMTQIRVALAIAFGYWALYSAYSGGRLLTRIILLIVAACFQFSILILIPFVVFWKSLSRPSAIFSLLIVLIPSGILLAAGDTLSSFNPMVVGILESAEMQEVNPFSLKNVFLLFIALIGFVSIKEIPSRSIPWYYLSLMGLGLWYGLMDIPVFAHRLLEIAMLSYFFWIPYLPPRQRLLAMAILFWLGVYLLIYSFFITPFFA